MVAIKHRWNSRPWSRTRIEEIPNSPGVYLLLSYEGNVNYVGKSNELRRRLMEHYNDEDVPGVRHFMCYQTYSTRDAEILERQLLNEYDPPYNV